MLNRFGVFRVRLVQNEGASPIGSAKRCKRKRTFCSVVDTWYIFRRRVVSAAF